MRLNVVGLGMVGLPTALLFAAAGCEVLGIDVDAAKLEAFRAGRSLLPLEPDVADLLRDATASRLLTFATTPRPADAHIVSVGTPLRDGVPDVGGVRAALLSLVPVLSPGTLVVIESTVPPGTTEALARELRIGGDVLVGHAPERVSPGQTLREMRGNPRVVGGTTPLASEATAALYRRISSAKIDVVNAMTAEFTKLIENTYRDVNIGLANELALIASDLGVDVWHATDLANGHPRVHIHRPGPGVGGHCIGVAPYFLRAVAPDRVDVLMAARRRNEAMPAFVARQIADLCHLEQGMRVAILGLAYKPDVADDRDSPSRAVAHLLETKGADVRIHDPLLLPGTTIDDVVRGAHCIALLVAHSAYRSLSPTALAPHLVARNVFDGVHALDRSDWEAAGFEFRALAERRGGKVASAH